MIRLALVALVIAGCTATPPPARVSPAPSPGTASPSATSTPGPLATSSSIATLRRESDGTVIVSIPDCVTTRVAGQLAGCELLQGAVDRGVFGAVLRWSDGTLEGRSVDLATGEMRVLRAKANLALEIQDIRDSVVLMTEYGFTGPGAVHLRLLRIPWRDPARAETLDELDLQGLAGGDSWNPWPTARTNGRDVVWLHGGGLLVEHELVLLGAGEPKRTIFRTGYPVWFDIDDAGRVAIAGLAADRTKQELLLWDGTTLRRLGIRELDAGGSVMSFGDVVGWTRGYGNAQPPSEVELVSTTGAPSRAATPETGCIVAGGTLTDVVMGCSRRARLMSAATGAVRDGPPSLVVLPFSRGFLWRTSADAAENPEIWRVTLQ